MSAAGMPDISLRLERAESSRLAWAFVISVALHLLIFGSYQAGKQLGWWRQLHWPAWLQAPRVLTEILKKKQTVQEPQKEAPLMFIDVSPAQATPEPPKKAAFYSDKNARAANPGPSMDSDIPRITGTQTQVPKTEDVPQPKFVPLQPSAPVEQAKQSQEELKAK